MTRATAIAFLAATVFLPLSATPSAATPRHRHRHREMLREAPSRPQQPFSFYPENIEGGVSGNLPFNNQVRKLRDPLNANGGR